MSDNETKETQVVKEIQNTVATESNNEDRKGRRGQHGEGRRGERRNRREESHGDGLLDRVMTINRMFKIHRGGRTFSFTALAVVSDGNGIVGVGYGKSREVPAIIVKGQLGAKKYMFSVSRVRGTITHPVQSHNAAGTALLRPTAPGTGVIASGSVRVVMERVGIIDALTKPMGSTTVVNVVRVTADTPKQLEELEETVAHRDLALGKVVPDVPLRARTAGIAETCEAHEEAAAVKVAEEKDDE